MVGLIITVIVSRVGSRHHTLHLILRLASLGA